MTVTRAHFTLIDGPGDVATGCLDVVIALPTGEAQIAGIIVDLIAAARNDERAFVYPPGTPEAIGDAAIAAITALLVPQVRLLTRRRVIPLAHDVTFGT